MKPNLSWIAAAALMLSSAAAHAGPFILAGTDADDHGSFSSGANQDGWLFMQRALENLAPGVTNGNNTVVVLGSSTGTALTAATSAFNRSSLASSGWTLQVVDGAANITSFLQGGAAGAGIVMLDSGSSNVGGGVTAAELTAITANASFLDTYLDAGGGLFSQANGYDWLSPLLPGVTVATQQETGLALTAAGTAAFPGLANADLSAGPYHENFANFGGLSVLATGIGADSNLNVIIGSAGGSITNPTPPPVPAIPEPSTYALMLGGLGLLAAMRRRQSRKQEG